MAEKEGRAAKVAVGVSASAAILAAIALSRKAAVVQGGVQLPQDLWDLIIAIAASLENVDTDLDGVISAITGLSLGGGLGWPLNTDSLTSLRVTIPVAGVQLPYIAVPSGMSLVIKAWALNPGWLQVGSSLAASVNINQSFPMLPNEIVGYQIGNADQVWLAATAPGCFACLTVEQRKGGG